MSTIGTREITVAILYALADEQHAADLQLYMHVPCGKLIDLQRGLAVGESRPQNSLDWLCATDLLIVVYSGAFVHDLRNHELFRTAWDMYCQGELRLVVAYVGKAYIPDNDPILPLLVPHEPIPEAPRDKRAASMDLVTAQVAAMLRLIRHEIQSVGQGFIPLKPNLLTRPTSGELLLGRYRLFRRIRHDGWLSEWMAVDEQLRHDPTRSRTVIVHMLEPRSSGAQTDALREKVFGRIARLARDGLSGLGKILEPKAADGPRHFFVTEDVWTESTPEHGTGISLRSAVAQRLQGLRWLPLLLQVGDQLAKLHECRVDGKRLVHGAVNPDNIVIDVPGGPTMVRLNIFAGMKIWRPMVDRDPDDLSFLPPKTPVGTPSELDVASDIFGFAATTLFALLDGNIDITVPLQENCDRLANVELRSILRRALEDRPDEPYGRIAALCEDLRRVYLSAAGPAPLEMVKIPGGELWMGRKADDREARPHEIPRRRVRVSAFRLSQDPVAQSTYSLLMGGNPRVQPWGLDVPATRVSFLDAVEFCNRLSKLHGVPPAYVRDGDSVSWDRSSTGFRMPTEAEWEYAAAGPSREDEEPRLYPWGDDEPAARACWSGPGHDHHGSLERGPCRTGRHSQGDSPFGVRDMAGGICEWCWDWFRPYEELPPSAQPLVDPVGPPSNTVPAGHAERPYRIVRGGAWNQKAARWLRCSARYLEDQNERPREIGLRVASGAVTWPAGGDPIVN